MKRIEHYFVDEQEVSRDVFEETYVDPKNTKPLKITYEFEKTSLEEYKEENIILKDNIKILNEEIKSLKRELEMYKYLKDIKQSIIYEPTPSITRSPYEIADFTLRPEHLPQYNTACTTRSDDLVAF